MASAVHTHCGGMPCGNSLRQSERVDPIPSVAARELCGIFAASQGKQGSDTELISVGCLKDSGSSLEEWNIMGVQWSLRILEELSWEGKIRFDPGVRSGTRG